MTDAIRRGVRTLMWAVLAISASFAPVAAAFDLPATTVGKVMAVCGFTVAIFTAVINSLEDNVDWFPALLKKPASEGQNPVPDDAGDV